MDDLTALDREAKELVEKLIPLLPWQSEDVRNEFEAGEYIAAADGAIHDLGALRADIPTELLKAIEAFINNMERVRDTYDARFLDRLRVGFLQLKQRQEPAPQRRTA
jgi:hypothetical protein